MSYAPIPTEPTLNLRVSPCDESSFFSKKRMKAPISLRGKGRSNKNGAKSERVHDFPILVHCHLRWDWVWQRPQQFVSRLCQKHRILFVETLPPDASLATPLARFRT